MPPTGVKFHHEKIHQYNDNAWGLGAEKYRFDHEADWHSLYVMAFADSRKDMEPIAGYAFQKMWRPSDNTRVGAGYSVGVMLREDFNYVPLAAIAPITSVEYKQLALQSTYIFWLSWQQQHSVYLAALAAEINIHHEKLADFM